MSWDDRRAVDTYEWINVVTSIDFDDSPELRDAAGRAFKRPAGKSIKNVAWRAGYWGDRDGSRVFLGPARIAVCCEVDYKTAKLILRTLCAYKLLTLVQRGGGVATPEREGNGGEYRLTIPHELDGIAKVRSREAIEAAISALKEKNRNKGTGQRRPRNSRGNDAPVSDASPTGDTGQSVPPQKETRGNEGVGHGAMASAIPTQHLPVKENQPSLSDGSSSAPAPREPSLDERERDDESSEDPEPFNPDGFRERLVIKNGAPRHLATQVADCIEAANIIDGPGWWVTADRNGTLAVQVQTALASFPGYGPTDTNTSGPNCPTCRDTGRVEIRNPYEGDSAKLIDCDACTNDGRGGCRHHRGQKAHRCGACRADRMAAGNEQPRTSQRGWVAPKVNQPEGAHTASWERRRQQHQEPAEVRKARGYLAAGAELQAAMDRRDPPIYHDGNPRRLRNSHDNVNRYDEKL
ncbi:hypothetical protein ABZ949_01970 [Micromonospora tulbaghiae]|uniref:hypothetical protein n=1 Tax=Micromonospora tulbaghiae TaxID=479978 RepID=UPI0033EA5304